MAREQTLLDQRILVVEDDYLLALDVESTLSAAGAQVTGPYASEAAALAAIAQDGLHAAVIDINLGRGPSFQVAHALQGARIPFVFLTGYDQSVIPRSFQNVIRLMKPLDSRRIVRELLALLDPRSADLKPEWAAPHQT